MKTRILLTAIAVTLSMTLMAATPGFLTRLGVKNVKELPDKVVKLDPLTDITPRQMAKLVPFFFDDPQSITDEGEDDLGSFSLAGYRQLGKYYLLLYNSEYGDISINVIGIYDEAGNLTDYIQIGAWRDLQFVDYDNEKGIGLVDVYQLGMRFEGDGGFVVTGKTSQNDLKVFKPDEYNFDDIYTSPMLWTITTDFSYRIVADDGRAFLNKIHKTTEGNPTSKQVILDKGADLSMYSVNSPERFDRLNEYLVKNKVNVTAGLSDEDEYPTPASCAMGLLSMWYSHTPDQLFQWLYDNREDKSQHVVSLFEALYSMSWLDKYELVQKIEKIKDPAVRQYLSRLTAQWGPADAVG